MPRAVWRQDAKLAAPAIASSDEGAKYLQLQDGQVQLRERDAFRRQFLPLHAAELQAKHEFA
eukprot:3981037-Pyramimonas_sp.AAC.1